MQPEAVPGRRLDGAWFLLWRQTYRVACNRYLSEVLPNKNSLLKLRFGLFYFEGPVMTSITMYLRHKKTTPFQGVGVSCVIVD